MPTDQILQLVPNLGIAGFAIYIMWLMYKTSSHRLRQKDEDMIKVNAEIRDTLVKQLADNTRALNDNTQALKAVASRLH